MSIARRFVQTTTRAANGIVTRVLKFQPDPLSTKEIYSLALKEKPSPDDLIQSTQLKRATAWDIKQSQNSPQPPNPDHPIRSICYLKKIVLASLLSQGKIEKIHTKRILSDADIQQRLSSMSKSSRKNKSASLSAPVDVWLWRLRAERLPVPKAIEEKETPGAEVGVGEDWSHLNKRRKRARLLDVSRDYKISEKRKEHPHASSMGNR